MKLMQVTMCNTEDKRHERNTSDTKLIVEEPQMTNFLNSPFFTDEGYARKECFETANVTIKPYRIKFCSM